MSKSWCEQFTGINYLLLRLDGSLQVKIADFGISRVVEEKEYYAASDGMMELPIRWMSPESILKGNFSTKSDVVSVINFQPFCFHLPLLKHFTSHSFLFCVKYSYGVLLWEIFTEGEHPFKAKSNLEILETKSRDASRETG